MTDLTPGELAKIDQIHAAVTSKLAELISNAAEGIRTEGEAVTASALAGTAHGTDHNSVSTLLAAALIRLARYQMRDQKRAALGEPVEDGYTQPAARNRHPNSTPTRGHRVCPP